GIRCGCSERGIFLCSQAPCRRRRQPRGDKQGPLGALERRTENFDSTLVDLAVLCELREVVDETCVNHAVRGSSSAAQTFQVGKITAMHLGTQGDKGLGARIGASK